MSCPNCGAQLEVPSQNFCQDCGKKLPDLSSNSDLAQKYSVSQEVRDVHQLQQKPVKHKSPHPHSKSSLGLGIISVIIAATTFNFGTSFLIEPFILPLSVRKTIIIAFGILNLVGIVLGIVSIMFRSQAKRSESLNKAMRVGSVLGILGTILNSLLMIAAFTLVNIFVV